MAMNDAGAGTAASGGARTNGAGAAGPDATHTNRRKGPLTGGIPMRAHLWLDSRNGIEPVWQADGSTAEGDAR